jgi:hypothetical protein
VADGMADSDACGSGHDVGQHAAALGDGCGGLR